jgi:hypothetical protein
VKDFTGHPSYCGSIAPLHAAEKNSLASRINDSVIYFILLLQKGPYINACAYLKGFQFYYKFVAVHTFASESRALPPLFYVFHDFLS